jgi:hypothetical protein
MAHRKRPAYTERDEHAQASTSIDPGGRPARRASDVDLPRAVAWSSVIEHQARREANRARLAAQAARVDPAEVNVRRAERAAGMAERAARMAEFGADRLHQAAAEVRDQLDRAERIRGAA